MRRWAEAADSVSATRRTSEKVRLLAAYLSSLSGPELATACVFLTGRPFPATDPRAAGAGWVAVRDAVERAAGAPPGAFAVAYDRSSDPGRATHDLLAARAPETHAGMAAGPARAGMVADPARAGAIVRSTPVAEGGGPGLADVEQAFAAIVEARGHARRVQLLADLLGRCDPLTAMYVVKVLTGELRIGLREGLVAAAIASAFDRPQREVQRADMATGDIGETALLARDGRLAEALPKLFRPLLPMLASPARDEDEILRRLGQRVWAEDKYDGIRAQLHRRGRDVRLFSRDLHDISTQFPEVVDAARPFDWDGILDGELLAMRGGAALPFATLQQRLGRKAPSAAMLANIPAGYMAFDVLLLRAGRAAEPMSLLDRPLEERRHRLESLGIEGDRFALAYRATADGRDALEQAFVAARSRANEGLVVKDPTSGYTPGRRGLSWLKLKKALATLDCVVVGVEVGHGKRHGVLSDYTFAVRDDRPGHAGELVTLGKAYSGLTDAEIAEMTRWFEAHTLQRLGRFRLVEPVIVVEVAFDRVQRSGRHGSGFALRFPRIARLRQDKSPAEADTLSAVAALAG